jgi:hypothetical protein
MYKLPKVLLLTKISEFYQDYMMFPDQNYRTNINYIKIIYTPFERSFKIVCKTTKNIFVQT